MKKDSSKGTKMDRNILLSLLFVYFDIELPCVVVTKK
jgi:hypothetical protein